MSANKAWHIRLLKASTTYRNETQYTTQSYIVP